MRLRIDGIDCYYDHSKILEDVTFEVVEKESLGIIGPNGSGKTTLLRCISGILEPRRGVVLLDERSIWHIGRKELARRIGVVPQTTSITFDFTTFEIVLMGRSPHLDRFEMEGERDYQIVKKAMQLTDCWHLEGRRFSELSGGEQQRVIVARALAQEPRILLLDEPTSHLDIGYQLQIMDLIEGIREGGNLITISVSHDLNLASRYCDKLILLNQGKIEAMGKAKEVLTPSNIQKVYGVEAFVQIEPRTGRPHVIPLSSRRSDKII